MEQIDKAYCESGNYRYSSVLVMLGYYEAGEYYTLWKFMIDEKYQNKEYGKKALRLGIDYLIKRFKVKEVYTAYYATNRVARNLYASSDFVNR